jgi:regulator of protease activity HflC (stomatin/prohibitin superfamily)
VEVIAEITIRYQLIHDSVAVLHQFIGPDYLKKVVAPEIGRQTRQIIAQYKAEEVYSTKRTYMEGEIADRAKSALKGYLDDLYQPNAIQQADALGYRQYLERSILILDTLVLNIEMPSEIVAAINRKIDQFYQIAEYGFRAAREAEESKRKQIEANGIAAFQRTVSQGISDSYLRWQGIQATLALAQSNNTKIVIIGTARDGLPIILGNTDTLPEKTPTGTPISPEKQSSADSSRSPASSDRQQSGSLSMSDIRAIISWLSEALHITESEKGSEIGTNSK